MTKSTSKRSKDPFLQREQQRYAEPLPSREYILEVLKEAGIPMAEPDLMQTLGIRNKEIEAFGRRLGAMERDGQILRNRRGAVLVGSKLSLITGTVEGHPDGYGFLISDQGSSDLYLNSREMQKVLHGDRVVVKEVGRDRRGRQEAEILEVTVRANTTVVGLIKQDHDITFLVPSDRRLGQFIQIPHGENGKARTEEVVVVEIVSQPQQGKPAVGRVVEVLGNATDPGIEIELALHKHKLPHRFSAGAIDQATKISAKISSSDLKGRRDLRDLPLVTIDGEDARDFDDAVWAFSDGKEYRLVVAIADVSHYVRAGTGLDLDARERSTSVYFPRRVIPMLPEKLSNDLCSLKPDVDRLCVVCDMQITQKGEVRKYSFYPAVIRSRSRLTYGQAWDYLSGNRISTLEDVEVRSSLDTLHDLFNSLQHAREKRGAIDFDTTETKIHFDEKGRIREIVPLLRTDAHRLIEECMLAANASASDFLAKAGQPVLYRVHEGPTDEKLALLRDFLKEFGLHLQGGKKPAAKDYANLVSSIKARPDFSLLQMVLLRSLQQAVYKPENAGHFGLAYDAYVHFTSPIRRYPDLLVHRAIKAVLDGERYSPGDWAALGVHCSQCERRADDASREVASWLKCYYMKDRVGDIFHGSVSGVAGFGLFVTLEALYVEGMIHVSELGNDYFHFEPGKHLLIGERTGQKFRLGDRISVKVVRVDLETRRLDFVPADQIESSSRTSAKTKKRRLPR